MKLLTPSGMDILGTFEQVDARADIEDVYIDDETGLIEVSYSGNTEIFWDTQRTVIHRGKAIFLGEDGHEYTLDELMLVDDSGRQIPIKDGRPDDFGEKVSKLIQENAR